MTNTKKKTILFDLDGTLFDSIPTILKSFQETFAELNEAYPGDQNISKKIGSNLQNILGDFLPADKLELGSECYRKIYLQKQDQGMVALFDDTREVLEYLKIQDYVLGIVTTKMRKYTEPLLQQTKIQDYFKLVIGSEDVAKHKPLPDPLLKAVDVLNTQIEETVYVGDALIDMQSARSAKMDFVAVKRGTTSKEAFQNVGQKIVLSNLLELKDYF